MSFEASPKIVLKADEVTVAESEDVELWQYVLSKLSEEGSPTGRTAKSDQESAVPEGESKTNSLFSDPEEAESSSEREEVVARFSERLSVERDVLKGACDPRLEPPYIHLDKHRWQQLKKELPSRGPNAIPSIVIAASILAIWLDTAKLEDPTVDEAQSVLKTIDTRDRNPGRGFSNCQWLQKRDGEITLDPAKIDMAVTVARAYCKEEKPQFED